MVAHPRSALTFALALSAALAAGARAAEPGAAVFARVCAVCHGAQGDGIPGSFPPLHEQVTAFAKTPEGREYLVMVVSAGLIGDLPVAGLTYRGVMPPQSALSDEEVAAALSYVSSGLGKLKPPPRPFSVKEVVELRARHPGASGQTVRSLRPAAANP
jgi:mono/diheme cytochrome c family protein